jgi:hypothetical protein
MDSRQIGLANLAKIIIPPQVRLFVFQTIIRYTIIGIGGQDNGE